MTENNHTTWIAQRRGQDWQDDSVLEAANWLKEVFSSREMDARISEVEKYFQAAKQQWAQGNRVPLFDPQDKIAWYIHQAERYADPSLRPDFFLPEGYRIAPLFRRLGQLMPHLHGIKGADECAMRLLSKNKAQPDDGIYELLVAGAYKCRGWNKVEFVPEAPGLGKRNDLRIEDGSTKWAVECKRTGRSGYGHEERLAGEQMASQVHKISQLTGRSMVVLCQFTEELCKLDDGYLTEKIEHFLGQSDPHEWQDDGGRGVVFDTEWADLHAVMRHDDIYFGSSRMVELLLGQYDPIMDFSMEGSWTPAEGRPLHATWVEQASLVVWRSISDEAARRKARHFRSVVSRASQQLPGDIPGAVHVGYETIGGNSVDGLRHYLNSQEMQRFDAGKTGLRMVYGNYFMPELVTSRNESCAVTETLAWYPVGADLEDHSLPDHMLFSDEDGLPGTHL
jgi:hypothetical protein